MNAPLDVPGMFNVETALDDLQLRIDVIRALAGDVNDQGLSAAERERATRQALERLCDALTLLRTLMTRRP